MARPFLDLPPALLRRIVRQLSPASLATLRCTSKQAWALAALAQDCLTTIPAYGDTRLDMGHVTELAFNGFEGWTDLQEFTAIVEALSATIMAWPVASWAGVVTMSVCIPLVITPLLAPSPCWRHLLSMCPALRDLTVTFGTPAVRNVADIFGSLQAVTALRSLDVGFGLGDRPDGLAALTQLQRLCLMLPPELAQAQGAQLLTAGLVGLTGLTSLQVSALTAGSPGALQADHDGWMAALATSLRELVCSITSHTSDMAMAAGSVLTGLTRLDVIRWSLTGLAHDDPPPEAPRPFPPMPALRSLTLEARMGMAALEALSLAASQLTSLSFAEPVWVLFAGCNAHFPHMLDLTLNAVFTEWDAHHMWSSGLLTNMAPQLTRLCVHQSRHEDPVGGWSGVDLEGVRAHPTLRRVELVGAALWPAPVTWERFGERDHEEPIELEVADELRMHARRWRDSWQALRSLPALESVRLVARQAMREEPDFLIEDEHTPADMFGRMADLTGLTALDLTLAAALQALPHLAACTGLRDLTLRGHRAEGGDDGSQLACCAGMRALTAVRFDGCSGLTPWGMDLLAQVVRGLRLLELRGCGDYRTREGEPMSALAFEAHCARLAERHPRQLQVAFPLQGDAD